MTVWPSIYAGRSKPRGGHKTSRLALSPEARPRADVLVSVVDTVDTTNHSSTMDSAQRHCSSYVVRCVLLVFSLLSTLHALLCTFFSELFLSLLFTLFFLLFALCCLISDLQSLRCTLFSPLFPLCSLLFTSCVLSVFWVFVSSVSSRSRVRCPPSSAYNSLLDFVTSECVGTCNVSPAALPCCIGRTRSPMHQKCKAQWWARRRRRRSSGGPGGGPGSREPSGVHSVT